MVRPQLAFIAVFWQHPRGASARKGVWVCPLAVQTLRSMAVHVQRACGFLSGRDFGHHEISWSFLRGPDAVTRATRSVVDVKQVTLRQGIPNSPSAQDAADWHSSKALLIHVATSRCQSACRPALHAAVLLRRRVSWQSRFSHGPLGRDAATVYAAVRACIACVHST